MEGSGEIGVSNSEADDVKGEMTSDFSTTEIEPSTPWTRSRKPISKTSTSAMTGGTAKRSRKRKGDEDQTSEPTPAKSTKTSAKGRITQKFKLHYTDFLFNEIGDRVLSCGEGDQLGHPGRTTTKKPRKVDVVEEEGLKVVQVVAGGVHSVILTAEGEVFACGINEKGTVPAEGVEPEGSTDEFTRILFSDEIKEQGKIVMLTAGASFTAALTDKGSVIAWGNLRDSSGEIDVHPLLTKMQEQPVIIIHHKKRTIVKIAAGENHLVMLSDEGKVLTFGDGSMGQLGRSTRISHIRSQYMVDESGNSLVVAVTEPKGRKTVVINDIHAAGFWTMVKSTDDRIFAFGLNNFGHLGIPLEEAETESDGKDTRELRVSLPTLAPAFSGHTFTHMDGVQHVIARTNNSEVYAIGKNTDNALGLGTWTGNNDQEHWKYETLAKVFIDCGETGIAGSTAKLGCSIAWTNNGEAYSWGCDTSGQLGLGIKDDEEKVVGRPQKITSAHLEGYKIISVSIADNHSLFLAKKV